MNNTISITELKNGEIAIINHNGVIVQNNYGILQQLSNLSVNIFDLLNITKYISEIPTHKQFSVQVLKPGTLFKHTTDGLCLDSVLPKPLFTTEDGVEIYPDSTVYLYNTKSAVSADNIAKDLLSHTYPGQSDGWLTFSTKQARENYLNEKLSLMTHDGVRIKKGDTYYLVTKNSNKIHGNYCYFEMPHNQYSHHLHDYFSTKEKAQEYVDNNTIYLTTDDGVGIKRYEYYYVVNRASLNISHTLCTGLLSHDQYRHDRDIYFSTKEKAEEYVDINRIRFTTHDKGTIKLGDTFWQVHRTINNRRYEPTHIICNGNNFMDHNTYIYFKSSLEAKEYIRQNIIHLTTDDGVGIKSGQNYWFVDKKTLGISQGKENGDITHSKFSFAYFSTQEKAQEYVDNNKIYLITDDGVGIKLGDPYWFIEKISKDIIFKSNEMGGAGQHDNIKHIYFSTEKKAEEYIKNSQKQFTLSDIGDFIKNDQNISQDTINRLKEYLKTK
jgi:hypothetical protein